MAVTYGSVDQFLAVYSAETLEITSSEISTHWMPYGALRVNEKFGGIFTMPFSSNNYSARELSIDFAYLGILLRTRQQDDSKELKKDLDERVKDMLKNNTPMILDDGTAYFADGSTLTSAWSTTQDYKNTFDMRNAINQRVDPDLINDLWDEDI